MTPAQKIAWHRSEADRIEAEERARRPALAAGQVWRHPEYGVAITVDIAPDGEDEDIRPFFMDGMPWAALGVEFNWDGSDGREFEYVGPASTHLRVVPPDPPAPQVAPEPTGAELVGRRCLFSLDGIRWEDYTTEDLPPWRECNGYHPDKGWTWGMQGTWFRFAKPYVEGVAP